MTGFFMSIPVWVWIVVAVWEVAWKGVALWRSARRGQTVWFVLLMVLNTVGILPIIYLLTNKNR